MAQRTTFFITLLLLLIMAAIAYGCWGMQEG